MKRFMLKMLVSLYKNPWIMGAAISQVSIGFLSGAFYSFCLSMILSCFLYTSWWVEHQQNPKFLAEEVMPEPLLMQSICHRCYQNIQSGWRNLFVCDECTEEVTLRRDLYRYQKKVDEWLNKK